SDKSLHVRIVLKHVQEQININIESGVGSKFSFPPIYFRAPLLASMGRAELYDLSR
ncbi:hypothetical protein L9F63_022981, partial [Diploptera punctata]